jgi:DNA-binding CsgD family transcriptional regulator
MKKDLVLQNRENHIRAKHNLAWEELDRNSGGKYSATMIHFTEKFPGLSTTELQICALVKYGMSSSEIGEKLFISERTVENHRTSARKKIKIERGRNLQTFLLVA